MRQIFFIVIIVLLFSSCKTRYITLHEVEHRTDSVTLVDTVVQIRLDVIRDSVSVKADSSFLSNKYAYSWARYDGELHHSLGIYEGLTPIVIKVPKEIVTITKYKDVPVPVERELSWKEKIKLKWFNFFACCCYGLVVIVLVLIKKR